MIAEIIPEAYDAVGHKTFFPGRKRGRDMWLSYPIGRFATCPLSNWCRTLEEVRKFLLHCRYVSDEKQFDKRDHWMSPEEFERRKAGDCDDFALWAWRQMIALGFPARFVAGSAGKYGAGHAWVTITKDGKHLLLEPLAATVGLELPRLSIIRYQPMVSVEWTGGRLHYCNHDKRNFNPSLRRALPLVIEWLNFWARFWSRWIRAWLRRLGAQRTRA